VMVNILGDAWPSQKPGADTAADGEPDWVSLLSDPAVKLHLYGKTEARTGRKMGHFTVTAPDTTRALEHARRMKARL